MRRALHLFISLPVPVPPFELPTIAASTRGTLAICRLTADSDFEYNPAARWLEPTAPIRGRFEFTVCRLLSRARSRESKTMYQRTLEQWRHLTPRLRRVVLGGVLVVMTAGGLLLSQAHTNTRMVSLFGQRHLPPSELTKVQAAFAKAKLSGYELEEGCVMVPRSQRNTYYAAVLKEGAAPAELNASQQEAFGKSSPFESFHQRDARLEFALEKDLAVYIRKMAGMEDASVHIDHATIGAGLRRQQQLKAMVVVQPSQPLSFQAIKSIRQMVAASKVQLSSEDVTVTDLSTGVSYDGNDHDLLARLQSSEIPQRKLACERKWNEKLRSVLDFIPGLRVATSVEFPAERRAPADQVPTSTLSEAAADISVSVGVPEDYLRQVWHERNARGSRSRAEPTPQDLAAIENETRDSITQIVSRLLPVDARTKAQHISVATFHDGTRNAREQLRGWNLPWWGWLSMVGTLALCLAAISIRGFLRDLSAGSMKATASNRPTALKIVGDHATQSPAPTAPIDPTAKMQSPPPSPSDPVNPGELARRIRENPQGVADLLKEWVDKAG